MYDPKKLGANVEQNTNPRNAKVLVALSARALPMVNPEDRLAFAAFLGGMFTGEEVLAIWDAFCFREKAMDASGIVTVINRVLRYCREGSPEKTALLRLRRLLKFRMHICCGGKVH